MPGPGQTPAPQAPPGPPSAPDSLELPSGPNAFDNLRPPPTEACYFGLGSQGYFRIRHSVGPVGVLDPGVPTTATTQATVPVTTNVAAPGEKPFFVTTQVPVTATFQTVRFPDTGVAPPGNAPTFGDLKGDNPDLAFGFKGAFGYRFDDSAVEISGFAIATTSSTRTFDSTTIGPLPPVNVLSFNLPPGLGNVSSVGSPADSIQSQLTGAAGRLDLPFFNAPPGFGGDKGLWLQADRVSVTTKSSLASVEFNYRYWCAECFQVMAGVRYVDQGDSLGIFTQDDVTSAGFDDPTRDATYLVDVRNRILAPQLGLEFEYPVLKCLTAGLYLKGAWGANFLHSQVELIRGDGLVGFDTHTSTTQFSQLYEMGAFVDLFCWDCIRLHAGYNFLWLVDVAEANAQIDYNLAHTQGAQNFSGNVFYHGPVIELQFVF
jgi:hypothetical protein